MTSALQLRCLVGDTDLVNDSPPRLRLDETTVTLVGEGAVLSTAELGINTFAGGGGLSFRSKIPIRLGAFDLDAGHYAQRWFDGVISQPDGAMEGDSAVYKLPCQGADLALDALSYHAQDGTSQFIITEIAADAFYNQVFAAYALVGAGAAVPLDLTAVPVTDEWATHLDSLVIDKPQTLRDLLTSLCIALTTAVRDADPTSTFTPAFAILPYQEATLAFGVAQLRFWDRAQQTVADLVISCDTPDVDEISPVSVTRKLDGSQQATGAVAVGADGLVGTARADASVIAQFPNPADPESIWWLPKVENAEWVTQEDVDAAAARILAAHQFDRETIEVSVFDYFLRPGQFIHFKHSVWERDGIYQVAQTTISWKDRKAPTRPLYTYQLGARLLRYGDTDDAPLVSSLPQILHVDPPSNLHLLDHGYDGATHTSYQHWGWDAPPSHNVRYYVPEIRIVGEPGGRSPGPVFATDLLVPNLPPSTGVTLTLRAVTFTHQFSAPVTSSIEVTDGPPSPLPPTLITYGATTWEARGVRQPIGWTLPLVPADWTHVHVIKTADPGHLVFDDLLSGALTGFALSGLQRGTNYTITLHSQTQYGDEGSATTDTFTAATESPAAPTLPALLAGKHYGSNATGGFLHTPFTASTFPDVGWYYWIVERTTGPGWLIDGTTGPADLSLTAFGLPINVPLRLRLYTYSLWGYPGPAATATFTISTPIGGLPPPGAGVTDAGAAETDNPQGVVGWYPYLAPGDLSAALDWATGALYYGGASLAVAVKANKTVGVQQTPALPVRGGDTLTFDLAFQVAVHSSTTVAADLEYSDGTIHALTLGTPVVGAFVGASFSDLVPAAVTSVRLRVRPTTTTADTVHVSLGHWGVAANSTRVEARAVLGSKQDFGIPAFMPGGSMEVANDAGTFADGYEYTGTATWGTPGSGDYEGSKAITLGGAAGPHTLRSPLAIWLHPAATASRWLRAHWLETSIVGGFVSPTVEAQCFDGDQALLSTIGLYDTTGAAFVWSPGATVEDAFINPGDVPTGTVYVAIYWSFSTAGGAAVVLDAVALDPVDTPVLTGLRLWDALTGGITGTPGQILTVQGSSGVGTWANKVLPAAFPTTGQTLDPATATTYYANFGTSFFATISLVLPSAVDWPGTLLTIYLEDPGSGNTITVDSDIGGIGDHIYGSAALGLWAVSSIPLTNQGCTLTLESDGRDSGGGHGAPIAGWWIRDYIA